MSFFAKAADTANDIWGEGYKQLSGAAAPIGEGVMYAATSIHDAIFGESPEEGEDYLPDVQKFASEQINDLFDGNNAVVSSIVSMQPEADVFGGDPGNTGATKTEIRDTYNAIVKVNELIERDRWYIQKYENDDTLSRRVINNIKEIPAKIFDEMLIIVEILDILARRNQKNKDAAAIEAAMRGMCDTILGLVNSATKVGFPKLPIIGDLGDILEELSYAFDMLDDLPPEVREELDKEVSWSSDLMDDIADLFDDRFAKIIKRADEDIRQIIENLKWLPLTLLTGLIVGILNAITQLFSAVGLGSFNIDSFIPDLSLISFDLDPSMFEKFAPPGNILEALIKALQMIPQLGSEVMKAIKNSFFAKLIKIFKIYELGYDAFNSSKVLAAANIHLLSCQNTANVLGARMNILQGLLSLQEAGKEHKKYESKKPIQEAGKSSPDANENTRRKDELSAKRERILSKYDMEKQQFSSMLEANWSTIEWFDPEKIAKEPALVREAFIVPGMANANDIIEEYNKPMDKEMTSEEAYKDTVFEKTANWAKNLMKKDSDGNG